MTKECACKIRKAQISDLGELTALALALWPGHTDAEMTADLRETMALPDAAFFLAYENDTAVGFAQCQLRHDYVEGTESSPVGYLEGIFVAEGCRHRGTARDLLKTCQNWAKEQGCREFASDCELSNEESRLFHEKVGFAEANRIICFTKKL